MIRPARYTARWVVPVTAPPIRDGAVLIAGGRIEAVGPAATVPVPDDALAVDLAEAAILPGLINAHAHPDLTLLRGRLEDLDFPDWIAALLEIRGAAGLTDADFCASARWGCIEMLRAGVTTVAATEDSIGAFTALLESGMRGVVYREVFGPEPAHADASLAQLRERVEAMRAHETDLVRVGVSPHSPISVSDALFTAVAGFARNERLPVAVHAAESAAERDLVGRGTGIFAERLARRRIPTPARARSTIELLSRTGILDNEPLLIHCVTVNAPDIERIADSGAAVAHCPVANARLGHGVAPVAALRDAGITVALGTDSVASNNRVDLLEESRAAQLFQRATTGNPFVLPAAEVLRMATVDGARALGLEDRVGELRAGLEADLCAIRLDRPHHRPIHDPVGAIVHSARASDVIFTVVRGRVLQREGEVLTLDTEAVRQAVESAADRVRSLSRGGPGPSPAGPR